MKSSEATLPARAEPRVVALHARPRRRDEVAFLPAALEIVETPPSPTGRLIAATIILLFCAALAWAAWGEIDIVATATGRVIASGRSKVVQPFETGVVRAIRVQDGQAVRAGDVLIELDPTVNAAERDHLRADLLVEQVNIARLNAAMAAGDDPASDFRPPADADAALLATQRQLLVNQVAEHRAKIAALARQQAQKEAEHGTILAAIHKLETMIPVIQPRVDIRKTLMDQALGSKLTYYETSSSWSSSRRISPCRRAAWARRRPRSARSARRAPRRWPNIVARSPTSSPRRSRNATGSPRT
jgi:hemolysin D